VNDLIKHSNNKRKKVQIGIRGFIKHLYCKCFRSESADYKNTINKEFKVDVVKLASEKLNKRLEIFSLFKSLDEYETLKKMFLNKNQCLLLDKRDLPNVIDKYDVANGDIKKINQEDNLDNFDIGFFLFVGIKLVVFNLGLI